MASKKVLPIWRADNPLFYDEKDKKFAQFKKQIQTHGFCDSETYGLDYTISCFILPRLKRFKKVNNGYPPTLTAKKWDNILNQMILAFELSSQDDIDCTDTDYKKIEEGLKLFAQYFRHLWWVIIILFNSYPLFIRI